jgi:hypothetical protein
LPPPKKIHIAEPDDRVSEFRENAQRDIQAANARDAAGRQQALQTFGEIVAGVAVVSLAVAAGAAMAAYAPPVSYSSSNTLHCESRNLLGTVYTDCQ